MFNTTHLCFLHSHFSKFFFVIKCHLTNCIRNIFTTLQAQLGSIYINDYNQFGRTYKVIIQADAKFRANPDDIDHLFVRNSSNEMVPISTFATMKPILGPITLDHYNLYRAASITGNGAPGYSSSEALQTMAELAEDLPEGFTFEWTGQALQELRAGNLAPVLFGFAILFVFLFLVAQYDSWSIPIAAMCAIPTALLGALLGLMMAGVTNNLYAQIGIILLIGLSTKMAILIVAFAIEQRNKGMNAMEAALEAARLRFRPVIMTSLAFIFGVLPLATSTGAGAASRVSIGVTVLAGMICATLLVPIFVPMIYKIVQSIRDKRAKPTEETISH
jgi:HAE1 family hydrophobic/amphiphilic exporter-1